MVNDMAEMVRTLQRLRDRRNMVQTATQYQSAAESMTDDEMDEILTMESEDFRASLAHPS